MTALDIMVLTLLGGGAVFGFMRGFVEETLSLIAWVLAILAIRFGHPALSEYLAGPVGNEGGAAVLAFLLLFVVTFFLGKWLARSIGARVRSSALGPIDRVLGFGFGAIKGLIVATLSFLLFLLIYETMYTSAERPDWITESRTYPLLNASGNALSDFIEERRSEADESN